MRLFYFYDIIVLKNQDDTYFVDALSSDSLLGSEYINVLGEFGGYYHKIKNPDFEKELNAIFGDK